MLCAFVAAICYGVATVAQAVAARGSARRDRVDPRLLADLLRRAPYAAGLGLDLLGFVASAVALHRLPLFFVQAVVTSSVGVTAAIAVGWLHVRLHRVEKLALLAMGAGLVMLAATARPQAAHPVPRAAQALILAGVAVVAVLGAAAGRRPTVRSLTGLSVAAGLGFAGIGIAARSLIVPHPLWRLIAEPLAWAIAGYGVIATLLFATALQRGSVTTAAALTFAVETILPTAVGVAFLGDRARPSLAALAAIGFLLTVASAIALSRHTATSARPTVHLEAQRT
jgi:drug/metabolite transporter (DMT)-like permease